MTKVAFLGTGLMGAPMAVNLAKAGHDVVAWNRTAAKTGPVVKAGGTAAATPAEAAARAEVVFTMLSDGNAVAETLFEQGLADALSAGALVIDTSSIPPEAARDHANCLAERGIGHLDAPVSGGPGGAESATLAIMAGGTEADFAKGQPLLDTLGRATHVGPPGAGQVAKLANQVIVGLTIGAVAEGLLLAQQGGADPAKVREAMLGGFADSKILQIHGQRMLSRTFVPGGAASIHLKDMNTILATAESNGLRLPLSEVVAKLFRDLVNDGGGAKDHSAILLELEKLNAPVRLGRVSKPD